MRHLHQLRLVTIAMLALCSQQALADTIFGPEVINRESGKPKVVVFEFSAPAVSYEATLLIENGANGARPVTSAIIRLNGRELATPRNFSIEVADIERPITLARRNVLEVELRGKPGSALSVQIEVADLLPIADAGPDKTPFYGEVVMLDGTNSISPQSLPLTYEWTITSRPGGSTSALEGPASATPRFTVDRPGEYIVELVVSDEFAVSEPDTIRINTRSIDYQLDFNSRQLAEIGADGGQLAAVDGMGRTFELIVPPNALTSPETIALTPVLSASGYPDGISPVAAVNIEPSGLTFDAPVLVRFDLLPSDRNGGWLGVQTRNDGSRFTFRPLKGSSFKAAHLEDTTVSVVVSHFSAAAIVETEPGAELPPPPPDPTAADIAIYKVSERIMELLDLGLETGNDSITYIDDPIIFLAYADWVIDIERRFGDLLVSPDIDDLAPLVDLVNESVLAFFEFGEPLTPSVYRSLDEALVQSIIEAAALYISITKTDRCPQDTRSAQGILNTIQVAVIDPYPSGKLEDTFIDERLACKYFVEFSPPFQSAFTGEFVPLTYVLTGEDGLVIPEGREFIPSSSTRTELSIIDETDNRFELAGSGAPGISTFGLTVGGGPESVAEIRFIPNLVGAYKATGTGGVSGCSDPEDEVAGSGSETIFITSQEIISETSDRVLVDISGAGNVVTEIDLTLTFSEFLQNQANGIVLGRASYSITEVEDGETFVSVGSGLLDGSVSSSRLFSGLKNVLSLRFDGGDNFCSSVVGDVVLESQ